MNYHQLTLILTLEEIREIRFLANSPHVVKPERIKLLADVLNRNGWYTNTVLEMIRSNEENTP